MIDQRTFNARSFFQTLSARFFLPVGVVCMLVFAQFSLAVVDKEGVAPKRPNIIVVMVDDMGYSDIGCYGGEIQTPNIDGLAKGGVRFTQFYNTARCCPTRASLLTGLYPHEAGMGHMTYDAGVDGYRGDLNKHCVTIAQVLKSAGYRTYMSGKWHVTKHIGQWTNNKEYTSKHNWPNQRGFDRFYGTITGAGSFYEPTTLVEDNVPVKKIEEGFFYTDVINDNTVRYIKEHARDHKDKPFFAYVAHTAPHWPLHASEEDIAKYKGRYDGGWDKLRAERFARMKKMGLIQDDWDLSPRDKNAKPWDKQENKAWMARRMEVYAAQIDCVDQGLGRVIEALKETGQFDNTLILFLADNGGCAEELGAGVTRAIYAREYAPDGKTKVRGGNSPEITPGPADTYASYGLQWANASNTPFRMYKHWVHEGGISTPLIAHWPAGIKARPGSLQHEPGHLVDIMATCVELAGAEYPKLHDGNYIKPLRGESLVPALMNREYERGPIYWEHEGNRAVRKGDFKLVSRHGQPWELYNMKYDRTELNNLIDRHQTLATEMIAMYEAYARTSNVKPWLSWRKPAKTVQAKPGLQLKLSFAGHKIADESPKKLRHTLHGGLTEDGKFNGGQSLVIDQNQAPNPSGLGITIQAEINHTGSDGVILAHGGSSLGYVLHVYDGKLRITVCRNGKREFVESEKPLPNGNLNITARVKAPKGMVLRVNDEVVARGEVGGPLPRRPIDTLEIGSDMKGRIGHYKDAHFYRGQIKAIELRYAKK